VRRCGRVLVVITIIAIMAGGILLTDNNMRELQGMEKSLFNSVLHFLFWQMSTMFIRKRYLHREELLGRQISVMKP
jgi:hypothetical protein